ncbi:MAG: RNA methyltransferase [Nevskia sp.]|nr:RNA methyltransferase [Nevskia sp.]
MSDHPPHPAAALQRVRIVLVEPQHPGNIGSCARAMKTMGLSQLVLVAPRRFPDPQAQAMAVGAADVLERARICATLDEALADCARVAATTARARHIQAQTFAPREWAQRLFAAGLPTAAPVALVFGRERNGLANEELDRAQELITIPTAPDYGSLNLAAAVQILAYELHLAAGGAVDAPEHLPVDQTEMERFYAHLERVLRATGFLDPANPRLLLRRLRRLYARAAPDANEMNILRGILTSVEEALARK